MSSVEIENLPVALERDVFLRSLIRELSGTLQDVVGLEEASGFISVVGQNIGEQINHDYKLALNTDVLSREQVADVHRLPPTEHADLQGQLPHPSGGSLFGVL